ncbi:hypothetical protein MMC29_002970 [Sticta canariensis]|nr:hypothetical protein [Sticta canariensis]
MTDAPPQLGEISHGSEMSVPTLQSNLDSNDSSTNGNASIQTAKDSIYNSERHPATQNVKDSISNGQVDDPVPPSTLHRADKNIPFRPKAQRPVAETVKDQHAKTTNELSNLAGSRAPPSNPAATGQPLTHYHSFFYNLLSWENPRATTLSFIFTVLFIFGARYLPALRWSFKVLYLALGVTAAAEAAGKLVFSQGLASSFRPRRYYTIPREALEASLEDVEQLINFFVIEFQRVLFAENLVHTITAFAATLLSYWLIRFLPFWGLSLIAVSTIYLGPLIYITNQEFIDQQLENASGIINTQANQVRDLAGHHAGRASNTVKAYAGDYTSKASSYIGSARHRSNSPELSYSSNPPKQSGPGSPPQYTSSDFPHAPKQEPTPGVASHREQYEKSEFGGQAEPSY